ncbi:RibD family protein [Phytoactinopolyspora endophytica]|uniref:RibD family protein n=1 Tax=Phytoactinopolyspora endophytica TaxID=1642495 RepID=UPI00101C12D7|nr:dihydrofolate reductase family protein [Phytoactinopolyspora endophytica]
MEHVTGSGTIDRPRVVVSVDASVDGRVTLRRDRLLMDEDASLEWGSLHPPSAQVLGDMRSSQIANLYRPQAVLEGSGSLVTESAGPLTGLSAEFHGPADVLYTDFLPPEVVEGPDHEKWFTVVDSRGRVRWHTKNGGGFDVLALVARTTPVEYLAYLRQERICYLVVGEERVDLTTALRRMHDQLGVTCVVSTAGGGLNGALLRAGLVDEIHLLVFPAAIGGRDTPTLFDGPELADGESPTRLRLLFAHAETDGMLWLRYEVIHEEAQRLTA